MSGKKKVNELCVEESIPVCLFVHDSRYDGKRKELSETLKGFAGDL